MLDEDMAISDDVAGMGNSVKSMQKDVKANHRREMHAAKAAKGHKRKEPDHEVTPEGLRRELDDSNSNPMQKKPRARRAKRGSNENESKPAKSTAEAPTESTAEASAPAPAIEAPDSATAPAPANEALEAPAPSPAIEAPVAPLVEEPAPTPAEEGPAADNDGPGDGINDAARRQRAADRRQQIADTNADVIRNSRIEDLQPPLGFTGKHHVQNNHRYFMHVCIHMYDHVCT